jgi:hypothetical protein
MGVSNTSLNGTGTMVFQPSDRLSGKVGRAADGAWHRPIRIVV